MDVTRQCICKGTFRGKLLIGPNPTDSGKCGPKRSHKLTDQDESIPLSVAVITAASTHNMKTAINVLNSNIEVERLSSKIDKKKQNLCLDKGIDFQEIEN